MGAFWAFIFQLKKLSRTRQFLIGSILMGALLIGIGIPAIAKQASQKRDQRLAAVSLKTEQNSLKVGEKTTATISIDSSKVGVEAAEFIIAFDPAVLEISDLSEGNFFKTYIKKEIGAGRVDIAAIATIGEKSILVPQGQGTVATFTITGKKKQKTTLSIDKGKTVVATDGKNIVKFGNINVVLDIR